LINQGVNQRRLHRSPDGDADQIVPYATSGPRAVKLLQNGTQKTYAGYPHGMPTTHADVINADLLAFLQS
jgi:non-heme chloroperoxidase